VGVDCTYAKYIGMLSCGKPKRARTELESELNISLSGIDTESLCSLVLELGDGFLVCGAIIRANTINAHTFDHCMTEEELVVKLEESEIHSKLHQNVIARNILVWRSLAGRKDTLPFPRVGIKLSSVDSLINECGGRSVLEGLTSTDVNNMYQKPQTIHKKSSYCDYLKTRDPNSVGAQVFISHAWKYKFLEVVDIHYNIISEITRISSYGWICSPIISIILLIYAISQQWIILIIWC